MHTEQPLVYVDDLGLHATPAGERNQPLAHGGAALARPEDLTDVFASLGPLGQGLLDERRVVEDHRQDVVEVVGHAPGEPTDAVEALGPVELGLQGPLLVFGPAPLGHVPQHTDEQPLAVALHVPEGHLQGYLVTVAMTPEDLDPRPAPASLAALHDPLERGGVLLSDAGIHQPGDGLAQQLGLGPAEDLLDGSVGEPDHPTRVHGHQAIVRCLGDDAVSSLARFEGGCAPLRASRRPALHPQQSQGEQHDEAQGGQRQSAHLAQGRKRLVLVLLRDEPEGTLFVPHPGAYDDHAAVVAIPVEVRAGLARDRRRDRPRQGARQIA